jgi:hypothetical protein
MRGRPRAWCRSVRTGRAMPRPMQRVMRAQG